MSEVIRMPELTGGMTGGLVLEWKKKIGDEVKTGELLCEIETDKATMEFEPANDGTLLYIGAEKGRTIEINEVIAVIGRRGENAERLIASDNVERLNKK
jgi:pyruvate dehydrogenase E2 component (dihydrolipoamide acetyltransferase)